MPVPVLVLVLLHYFYLLPVQVLDLVNELLEGASSASQYASSSDGCEGASYASELDVDGVAVGKLRQLKHVLRLYPFSGINRKIINGHNHEV